MFICCSIDELMKCTAQTYNFGDRTQGQQQFPLNILYGVAISINSTSKNTIFSLSHLFEPTHPVSSTKYTFCPIPKYNGGPNSNEEASSYSKKLSSTLTVLPH